MPQGSGLLYGVAFFFATLTGSGEIDRPLFENPVLYTKNKTIYFSAVCQNVLNKRGEMILESGRPLQFTLHVTVKNPEGETITNHSLPTTFTYLFDNQYYEVNTKVPGWQNIKLKQKRKLQKTIAAPFIISLCPEELLQDISHFSLKVELVPWFESEFLKDQDQSPFIIWDNAPMTRKFKKIKPENIPYNEN
jgi:hypothetical protein